MYQLASISLFVFFQVYILSFVPGLQRSKTVVLPVSSHPSSDAKQEQPNPGYYTGSKIYRPLTTALEKRPSFSLTESCEEEKENQGETRLPSLPEPPSGRELGGENQRQGKLKAHNTLETPDVHLQGKPHAANVILTEESSLVQSSALELIVRVPTAFSDTVSCASDSEFSGVNLETSSVARTPGHSTASGRLPTSSSSVARHPDSNLPSQLRGTLPPLTVPSSSAQPSQSPLKFEGEAPHSTGSVTALSLPRNFDSAEAKRSDACSTRVSVSSDSLTPHHVNVIPKTHGPQTEDDSEHDVVAMPTQGGLTSLAEKNGQYSRRETARAVGRSSILETHRLARQQENKENLTNSNHVQINTNTIDNGANNDSSQDLSTKESTKHETATKQNATLEVVGNCNKTSFLSEEGEDQVLLVLPNPVRCLSETRRPPNSNTDSQPNKKQNVNAASKKRDLHNVSSILKHSTFRPSSEPMSRHHLHPMAQAQPRQAPTQLHVHKQPGEVIPSVLRVQRSLPPPLPPPLDQLGKVRSQ
jgi:hypothetical protein